jgi:hypothetical protein
MYTGLPPNLRLASNRNLKTRSDRMTGATNLIGATWAWKIRFSRWRRNFRPSRENLGRCRNKTTSIIIPRWNKKIRPFGWTLGRISNRSIQSVYPGGSDQLDLSGSGIPIGS